MNHRVLTALSLLFVLSACEVRPRCDVTTCGGCCDANGECQSGNEVSSCGFGGRTCDVCDAHDVCGLGACVSAQTNLGSGGGGGSGASGGGAGGGGAGGGGDDVTMHPPIALRLIGGPELGTVVKPNSALMKEVPVFLTGGQLEVRSATAALWPQRAMQLTLVVRNVGAPACFISLSDLELEVLGAAAIREDSAFVHGSRGLMSSTNTDTCLNTNEDGVVFVLFEQPEAFEPLSALRANVSSTPWTGARPSSNLVVDSYSTGVSGSFEATFTNRGAATASVETLIVFAVSFDDLSRPLVFGFGSGDAPAVQPQATVRVPFTHMWEGTARRAWFQAFGVEDCVSCARPLDRSNPLDVHRAWTAQELRKLESLR